MPRTYFARAAAGGTSPSGTVIADLQSALAAHATGRIDVDGVFGGQTEAALRAFQTSKALDVTGTVTATTWGALMNTPEPPIFERCLQVVAAFEGTGFAKIEGNFDGAGLTWGIVGFTLANGELGTLLREIRTRCPARFTEAFGPDAETVLAATAPSRPRAALVAWGNSLSTPGDATRVTEPWRSRFRALGEFREVQAIQIAWARDRYWKIALRDAAALNMAAELDLLLLYDIAVQNGGMRSKGRLAAALAGLKAHPQATATERRRIVADAVTATIGRYEADVAQRKTTIALGHGTVHGSAYRFADWGLIDGVRPAV